MKDLFYNDVGPSVTTNPNAMFQPYTLTSGTGVSSSTVNPQTGQVNYLTGLNPTLSNAQGAAQTNYGQTQNIANQLMANNQGGFNGGSFSSSNQGLTGGMMGSDFSGQPFDINQATDQYFQQGMNVLNPAFQQQNSNLAQSLQGSGRGGLMLSAGAVGADGGGMVNPDMYNTGAAQSNALANLYQQSRQSALGEQNQMFGQGLTAEQQRMAAGGQMFNQDLAAAQQAYNQNLGTFQTNQGQAALYQQLANQQLGGLGMFSDMENNLYSQGLAGEQVRTGSNADAMSVVPGGVPSPTFLNSALSAVAGHSGVQDAAFEGIKNLWNEYNPSTYNDPSLELV